MDSAMGECEQLKKEVSDLIEQSSKELDKQFASLFSELNNLL